MNKVQNFFNQIKSIWIVFGITIVFLLSIELVCGLIMSFVAKPQETLYMPMLKAAYPSQTWINEYIKEHIESSQLNWQPYVYWKRKPYRGKYINVNSQGLRKTWNHNNKIKKNKLLKIFMFGGSTMWSEFSRDEYSIPSQLSKIISKNTDLNVKVFNYGETGYVSTQELITLIREIDKGNIPDIVVFYDGVNDTFASLQSGVPGNTHNEYKRENGFKVENSYSELTKKFISDSINNSSFFKLLTQIKFSLFNMKVKFITYESDKLADDTVNYYVNNIKIADKLGEEYKFKTLYYWQPIVYTKNIQTPHEKQKATEKNYIKKVFLKVYKRIKQSKYLTNKDNFVNLSEIFNNNNKNIFIDECHITETANFIIAERIFQDVLLLTGSNKKKSS